jgi:hypothetical protein
LTTNAQQRLGAYLLATASALLLLAIARWALMPAPEVAGRLPDAAEMDSLRPYLAPAPPLPAWLDETRYAAESEVRRPPGPNPWRGSSEPGDVAVVGAGDEEGEGSPPPRRAGHELTAVFQGPRQTVAVIDDRQVRRGDVIPGGVRVATIAADHVVLRAPDGSEQVLMLRREGNEE